MTVDDSFMRAALDEAVKGAASPNPHVGAILVDPNGAIVGRGFHPRPGREHAEVMAIREAGARARGATLYVTLEPCNHHGRTPPCTEAILAAGVAKVVVGVRDPNPHVEGHGNERLRAAGVEIVEGVLGGAAARIVAPFAKHVRTGRPWVRLKLAASLDGRIAAAPAPGATRGVSRWITGPEARRRVHELRARVDAVAVGIGTALADDPSLTVREVAPLEGRDPPARVVFDSTARLPLASALVRSAREIPVHLVCAEDAARDRVAALEAAGVKIATVARSERGIDLAAALDAIGRASIVDLLVEGGAEIAGALVARDLVDELHWFVAPIALGASATAALVGPSPSAPDRAPRFVLDRVETAGDDAMLVLYRRSPEESLARSSEG